MTPSEIRVLAHTKWPNRKITQTKHSLRIGNKGSISVELEGDKRGLWFDFEKSEGGNLINGLTRALPTNVRSAISYTYRGRSGELLGNVLRVNTEEGKKILQTTITEDSGIAFKAPAAGYGVYSLERLDDNPDAVLVIVEGEPKADILNDGDVGDTYRATQIAANEYLPPIIGVTAAGGAASLAKADWGCLMGRNVILWPDNDEAGMKCMSDMETVCKAAGAVSIRRVQIPDGVPAKWDVADAEPLGVSERANLLVQAWQSEPVWINDSAQKPDRIIIEYQQGHLSDVAKAAELALIERDAAIFRRGSVLVRPEAVEICGFNLISKTHISLRQLTVPMLVETMSREIDFVCQNKNGLKSINPPESVAKSILVRQDNWPFRTISGVLATPTIRPDGTLLLEEGYDVATKLYISALPKLPKIPELLNRDDAVAAGKTLETLLTEFPFADETSRSVALSGMISTICRGGFTVAPLHAITAPTPGSGKSYLVDVISTLAIGSQAPVFSWSLNMDENEKRIDGALLEGSAIIAIDNVSTEFGGDKICQAIERPSLSVRRLGSSDRIEVANRSAILANGNNITLKGDITRRSLLANLDPKMERPEHRQFKHSPIEMILMDRGTYLSAALVIVAAYKQAGSPDLLPRLASFEGWSDMVRSALVWIGYVDPVNSMRTIIDDDPEHQIRHEFCAAWAESKLEPLTVDDIIRAVEETVSTDPDNKYYFISNERRYVHERFREAVAEVATISGNIDKDALSKFLRSIRGRVFGNHIVTKHDKRKAEWSVQSASVQG